jgi:hypothetical protein
MNTHGTIVLLAVAACIASILCGGCATADPLVGAVSAINPEYASAAKQIVKIVGARGEATDQLAGYAFTRTYFYDGSPVKDPSRITWVDKWERTASAGSETPPAVEATNSPSSGRTDAEIADELAAALEKIMGDK